MRVSAQRERELFRPHPSGKRGRVWVYDLQGNFIAEYPSIGVCVAETGLLLACISSMIRGEAHRSKSYYVRRAGVEWKPQIRKKYTRRKVSK